MTERPDNSAASPNNYSPIAGATQWLLGSDSPGPARLAALWLFTFCILVIHARIGVLLHEVGHAAACVASGGSVLGIDIKLFGGGWCSCTGDYRSQLFQIAGIIVNTVLGLAMAVAAFALISKRYKRTWLAFALGMGAAINFAGATHYATLSSFYGYGDLHNWPRFWIAGLVAFIVAMPVGLVIWSEALRSFAPSLSRTIPARLLTVFVPFLLYGACLFMEQHLSQDRAQFAALQAEDVAIAREIEQLRERKLEEWRDEHPQEEAPPEVLEVSPDEVTRPFPMLATVLLLDVVFVIAALVIGRRRWTSTDTDDESSMPLLGAAIAAAAVLSMAWLVF